MSEPVFIKLELPALQWASIFDSLHNGLDYAQSSLIEHDTNLGRTTRKNKQWAEQIERDIANFQTNLEVLGKRLQMPYNTNYENRTNPRSTLHRSPDGA